MLKAGLEDSANRSHSGFWCSYVSSIICQRSEVWHSGEFSWSQASTTKGLSHLPIRKYPRRFIAFYTTVCFLGFLGLINCRGRVSEQGTCALDSTAFRKRCPLEGSQEWKDTAPGAKLSYLIANYVGNSWCAPCGALGFRGCFFPHPPRHQRTAPLPSHYSSHSAAPL